MHSRGRRGGQEGGRPKDQRRLNAGKRLPALKRTAWGCTKIKRLMRALDVPQYVAVGILESLWNLTARETPAGNIGKLSNEDIALQIDWRENPDTLIQGLFASGWIDVDEELRYYVHDWHEHADDAVDNALARAGKRYANGQLPRMKRLSDKEKAALIDKFRAQKPTSAHSVRTESHEKPLPSLALPEPMPNTPPPRARDAEPEAAPPEEPARPSDDPPPGWHGLQYAAWLLERRNIPAVPATLRSGSAAIKTASRKYGKSPNEAVVLLDSLAAQAQARGQPVNKFWLEDPDKWEAKEATSATNPGKLGRPFDPGINTAPQPTEDEIEKIRAIIEAKQAALIAEGKIPSMRKVLQRAGDCRT